MHCSPPRATLFPYTTLFRSQIDAVLRAFRAGHAGMNLAEVEFEHVGIFEVVALRHAEEILRLEIIAEGVDVFFAAARREQRSEEHTSELQSRFDLVCRLLLE